MSLEKVVLLSQPLGENKVDKTQRGVRRIFDRDLIGSNVVENSFKI